MERMKGNIAKIVIEKRLIEDISRKIDELTIR